MSLQTHEFASTEALNETFATKIIAILQIAIAEKGQASLIVSGGNTPKPLFAALSQADLDWSKVVISLADDRWVDINDAASNDKLVREHLLVGNAVAATFISLKHDFADANDAVSACEAALSNVRMPFDVLILGMGEDGHTASLFPCSKELQAGLDLNSGKKYIAVQPTTAPHQRMSLTLPALLASSHIFLHLTGSAKQAVVAQALASTETQMPIKAVLDRANVQLMWAP
ncbi:MAG: 6-phosphogluconolactonase [Glaciecola sp.]|nr:6-phosphogluconolactonase [Glaciecola sp.]MDG1469047.1 6-phosphogluconolactonase [Glaciecola sp.]MDG1922158.1 6-phosphogluconolactonase [Glaciecola sp.]